MNPDDIILPRDLPLWHDARPYLDVRNNDEHTIVAYALARILLDEIPEADESVVLPAVLLHDVGWKRARSGSTTSSARRTTCPSAA